FKDRFGEKFNNRIDELLKYMLHLDDINKQSVEKRISQMMEAVSLKNDDFYLTLIENLGKFMSISRNEKYTPDKLIRTIINESNKRIKINKDVLTTSSALKSILNEAAFQENRFPN